MLNTYKVEEPRNSQYRDPLNEALGGVFAGRRHLLIIYVTYSRGWVLGLEVLRKRIEMGTSM